MKRLAVTDDVSLLSAIAGGDLEALGRLYDRYAPQLLQFAARTARPEDAEDVVQTVFLRVLRTAASFDANASSARPWLYGMTARVASEQRRSLRRWAAAMLGLSREPSRAPPVTLEERDDLERELGRLSVVNRTALVLAEVEGFTCEEIATMLGIPVGTVWRRLHDARRVLRHALEGDGT